ncbi:MAG: AI-2E family transporter [Bacillota bacterium]|nr:AI-2E family transporter [Bacillota bacterium]
MMNKDYLNRSVILKILGILAFAIGLNWLLQRYELLIGIVVGLFRLLGPLMIGAAIAFILNIPMRLIEHLIFRKPYMQSASTLLVDIEKTGPVTVDLTVQKQKKRPLAEPARQIADKSKKSRLTIKRSFFIKIRDSMSRPVSLFLSIVLVLGLSATVMVLVIPELINSIQTLAKNFPEFLVSAQQWIKAQIAAFPELVSFTSSFEFNWQQIGEVVAKWLEDGAGSILDSTYKVATVVFGGVFNAILSIIFAIYILFQKETISRQARLLLKAFVPDRWTGEIERIATLTNRTFNKFITGQFIEAVILGLLFLITMSIFRFPYVVLISVLIAFTALIPMIGAFIGCAIGVFMILISSPIQAFWFLILFLVLQQIENNFIYPRVVGSSIGLPAIWVLLAVMIGGSLFGVIGILLFIPVFSILYDLVREYIHKRIKHKAETVKSAAD